MYTLDLHCKKQNQFNKEILKNGKFLINKYAGRKDFYRGLGTILLCFCLYTNSVIADVLPTGINPLVGNVSVNQSGNTLNVNSSSSKSIVNYDSFSVGRNSVVNFNLPNANAAILNKVVGVNPSEILGQINSNGKVFLVNPNGIMFGSSAQVNVGSLLASTLDITDNDFLNGKLEFSQNGNSASVINLGSIKSSDGGFVSLLGGGIQNLGSIHSPNGSIALGVGKKITLNTDDGVSLGLVIDEALSQEVQNVANAIHNEGTLTAHSIKMAVDLQNSFYSRAINNDGVIEATTLNGEGGVVQLLGTNDASNAIVYNAGNITTLNNEGKGGTIRLLGDWTGLDGNAVLNVSGTLGGGEILIGGDFQGRNPLIHNGQRTFVGEGVSLIADSLNSGDGGRIIVWADENTIFNGSLFARGGINVGDGGFAEVSGKENLIFNAKTFNLSAPEGGFGTLLLDPRSITIANTGTGTLAGADQFSDTPSTDVTLAVSLLNNTLANVELQANRDITFTVDLNMTTLGVGIEARAGRNIIINSNLNLVTNNGNLTFVANDSSSAASIANRGTGNGGFFMNTGSKVNIGTGSLSITVDSANTGGFSPGVISMRNITASQVLVKGGSATQSVSLAEGSMVSDFFLLEGMSSLFNFGGSNNNFGTIAANTTSGNISIRDVNGFAIGTVGSVNGFTSNGQVTFENVSAVTQTQPLIVNSLRLIGSGGYTLTNVNNDIGLLAINTSGNPVSITESNGFTIGTINNPGLTTGGQNLTISTPGLITFGTGAGQDITAVNSTVSINAGGIIAGSGSIINAANLLLQGSGTFDLNQPNTITTLATNTSGSNFNFSDNDTLQIGTVLGVSGLNSNGQNINLTTGGLLTIGNGAGQDITALGADININSTGVTEGLNSIITSKGLSVQGTGTFNFNQANDVDVLASSSSGGVFSFNDVDALAIGTVNGVNGLNSNGQNINLTSGDLLTIGDGAGQDITASGAIIDIKSAGLIEATDSAISSSSIRLQGTGTFILDQTNDFDTFAGIINGTLSLRDTDDLTIGTVLSTSGITSSNNAITFSVNQMTISNAINSGSASTLLRQNTSGQLINLGGTDSINTLGLLGSELNLITAGVLHVGDINSGAITISGTISPVGTTTLSLQSGSTITDIIGGSISVNNLSLLSIGSTLLNNSNDVNTLSSLTSGGSFTFNDVDALTIGTVNGVVGLDSNGQNINLTTGGLLTIGDGAGQDITATGANVNINSSGVSEGAGSIISSIGLSVQGAGTFNFNQTNDVDALASLISGGSFAFNDVDALTIGTVNGVVGLDSNGQNINLTTGGLLTIGDGAGQDITTTGANVNINSSGVSEGAGSIVASKGLSVQGAGTFNLSNSNDVDTLASLTSASTFTFNDVDALTIGTVNGVVGLDSNGQNINLTSGGLLTIGDGAGQDITASGAFVDIKSAGITEAAGSTITSNDLRLQGSGNFNLNQTNDVNNLAGNFNGSLTFRDVDTLNIELLSGTVGIDSNNNDITLIADQMEINQFVNSGTANIFINTNTTGRAIDLGGLDSGSSLGLDSGDISNLAGNIARIGDSTSGAITLTNNISAYNVNALSLETVSGISKVGSSGIFGNDLAVRSVGNVDLNGDNDISTLAFTLTGNGSDFKFNDISSFSLGTVDGITSSTVVNGDINLSFGGDFSLTQNLNAGTGDITLTANGSDIDIISGLFSLTGNNLSVNTSDGNFTQDGLASGLSVSTSVNNYSFNTNSGTLKGVDSNGVNLISSNIGNGNVFIFNASGDIGINGSINGSGGSLSLETLGLGNRNINFGSSTVDLGSGSTLNMTTLNSGTITGNGSLKGGTLNLVSSGNVTQNGLSSGASLNIDFDNLNITSGGVGTAIKLTDLNDLNLNSLNLNSTKTSISAGGLDGDLQINGPFSGSSNLTLTSSGTGNILGTSTIVASNLTINTNTGNATQDGSIAGAALNTDINSLSVNTSSGTIKVLDTNSVNLSTSSLGSGSLTLISGNSTGAGINIIGLVNGGSLLSLNVLNSTGNITQSAELITGDLKLSTNGGNVTLENTGNDVSLLQGSTMGGNLSYTETSASPINTANISVGNGSLTLNFSGGFGTVGQEAGTSLTGESLVVNVNSGAAGDLIGFTNNNDFNNITFLTNSPDIAYTDINGFNIVQLNLDNNGILDVGNASLTSQSGNITQTGTIIAKNLNINTLNGSTTLNNVNNDLEVLSGNFSGGNLSFVDTDGLSIGNLTNANSSISITSDVTGGSGQITNTGISLIGDVSALGTGSNLTLTSLVGDIALSNRTLTAADTLTLNSAGDILGNTVASFPKLNGVNVLVTSAGLLGDGSAPIGIEVSVLSNSSSLNDGGRGVVLNYADITTLQKNPTNQYYLYPLYIPPPPPPPPPTPVPTPIPNNLLIEAAIDTEAAQSSVYNSEDNISVRGRVDSNSSNTTILIIDETSSLSSSTNFTPNGNMVIVRKELSN